MENLTSRSQVRCAGAPPRSSARRFALKVVKTRKGPRLRVSTLAFPLRVSIGGPGGPIYSQR